MKYEDPDSSGQEEFHSEARAVRDRAWSHVLPVRIACIEAAKEVTYNSGSGICLRLQGENFVLTAWHLVGELRHRQAQGEDARLVVGNSALEPLMLRYKDEENDIVVLDIAREQVGGLDAEPFSPSSWWPPSAVAVNDAVVLCGLPRYLRQESANSEIVSGDFSLMQSVAGSGEQQFVLNLDPAQWVDLGSARFSDAYVSLGGISGAPVFRVNAGSFDLVGIVKEVGEQLPLLCVASLAGLPPTFPTASAAA
jgi:hypothetical protein